MSKVVSPAAVAAGLTELWSPRVVASLDDSYVKVAKVHGTFGWHAHDDEDELFYVLAGHLRIEMADGAVELDHRAETEMHDLAQRQLRDAETHGDVHLDVHQPFDFLRCVHK